VGVNPVAPPPTVGGGRVGDLLAVAVLRCRRELSHCETKCGRGFPCGDFTNIGALESCFGATWLPDEVQVGFCVSQVKNRLCDHVESALAFGSDVTAASSGQRHVRNLNSMANIKRKCYTAEVDEGRKRVLLIAASILAARKLAQYDGGKRVPATVAAISDSVRWAEEIMRAIDERFSVGQK
jgi:hypothetical protein